MNRKTCVTVAEKSPKRMLAVLKRALEESDLAEIRLDFMRPSDIPEALELAKKSLKHTVCTLRPKSEGGRFPGTEAERISIIKLVAEYAPFLLDVEFRALKKNPALARYLKKSGTDVLVSWHDFEKTPGVGPLLKRLAEMKKLSRYVKIVTTATGPADASSVLSLYARAGGVRLVAFAMGDEGRISRILCLYLGSPFTYVSLGKPVAPGQFGLREIKKILR